MTTTQALAEALFKIKTGNASLKAFASLRDEASAIALAQQLAGPLAGQLVAVKDIFDTADLPTSYGSPIYAGYQPATEAAMVAIVRRAGGLVIGKSVTTEFAYLHPADTLNPAAPGCTPGGSSAGSAAAVAAGLVPLAIGSQTGGSTIRPASYCGIVGFKPSFAVLPTAGMKCFSWSLDTVGLFARTVQEVSLFAQAVSGKRIVAQSARAPADWVVGVPDAYPWGELSASAAAGDGSRHRGPARGRRARGELHAALMGRRGFRRARCGAGLGSGARVAARNGNGGGPAVAAAARVPDGVDADFG